LASNQYFGSGSNRADFWYCAGDIKKKTLRQINLFCLTFLN
jgi:hypothetical protein